MKTETKHTPKPLFWLVGNQLQWKATVETSGVADLPPEVAAELATLRATNAELLAACKIGLGYLESDYTGKGGRDLSNGDIAILRDAISKATT